MYRSLPTYMKGGCYESAVRCMIAAMQSASSFSRLYCAFLPSGSAQFVGAAAPVAAPITRLLILGHNNPAGAARDRCIAAPRAIQLLLKKSNAGRAKKPSMAA